MIQEYFRDLMLVIEQSKSIRSQQILLDQRDHYRGYVRGDIYFRDHSHLHFREFVDTEFGIRRFSYAYHYQNAQDALIFRYDDSKHFPNLGNFPHHKHIEQESNVVSADAPDLKQILAEIESKLRFE